MDELATIKCGQWDKESPQVKFSSNNFANDSTVEITIYFAEGSGLKVLITRQELAAASALFPVNKKP